MTVSLKRLGRQIDALRLELNAQLSVVHKARVALRATPEWQAYEAAMTEKTRISEALLKAERDYSLMDIDNREF